MLYRGEYTCRECGHNFDKLVGSGDGEVCCPRCGSGHLEHTPFLFGGSSAEDLTLEDYLTACLSPCCGDPRNLKGCPLPHPVKGD